MGAYTRVEGRKIRGSPIFKSELDQYLFRSEETGAWLVAISEQNISEGFGAILS